MTKMFFDCYWEEVLKLPRNPLLYIFVLFVLLAIGPGGYTPKQAILAEAVMVALLPVVMMKEKFLERISSSDKPQ